MSRVKLIVTGACGFIGGHITESSFRNSDFEVLALSGGVVSLVNSNREHYS